MLQEHFSTAGTVLLLVTGLVVGLLLTTDTFLFRALGYAMTAPYVLFHWLSFGRRVAVAPFRFPAEPLRIRESEIEARPRNHHPCSTGAHRCIAAGDGCVHFGRQCAGRKLSIPAAETETAVADPAARQSIKINPPMGPAVRSDSRGLPYALPALDEPPQKS